MSAKIQCVLVTYLFLSLHTSCVSAADFEDEISNCAAIPDDLARLSCYDELSVRMRQVNARGSERRVEQPLQTDGGPPVDAPFAYEPVPADEQTDGRGGWLGIKPYRRNYILPLTYNEKVNRDPSIETESGFRFKDFEIKFQLSFELPVWRGIYAQDLDLYMAYTQLSFFQAYNEEFSSPFRDTSYEPEVGLNWHPDMSLMNWRVTSARLALNHQSNGRTEPLSRSWNRLVTQLQAERGDMKLGLRLWHRFQEDTENDDNPDITDYLGFGELFTGYDMGPYRLGLMLRNPFRHGTVQIDWSRLINDRVRFYVQYYNGYGESLIDYDRQVNRLGIGFLLNEWP